MCGAELKTLPEGVQRIARVLQALDHPHAPVMLDDAARTAQQAADALGIAVGQIAKSIIFRRKSAETGAESDTHGDNDVAVLVITSGDRRVDEKKVAALVCAGGSKLGRADADFVKAQTGFSIDRDLFRFTEIWAAAGHPHAVFKLIPSDLARLTGAPVVDVAAAVATAAVSP